VVAWRLFTPAAMAGATADATAGTVSEPATAARP